MKATNARQCARIATVLAVLILTSCLADAQRYRIIHNFTGQGDGGHPRGNFVIDHAGNLYGTAANYGTYNAGTVFKLHPSGSSWLFNTIYTFTDENGTGPIGVTIGPDGSLFGVTVYSVNNGQGCGVIFNLKPAPSRPISVLEPWNEAVDHTFSGEDGCNPSASVAFDQAGNMYATAVHDGQYDAGTLVELMRSGSNWTGQTIHTFDGYDGNYPLGPVVFDSVGNLYGNTYTGGGGQGGTIYQMTPSGSGWMFFVLTDFPDLADGRGAFGGVILDSNGNVFGSTAYGGQNGGGTVFELTGGSWTFHVLYSFSGLEGPESRLLLDSAGNLYGVTTSDGLYQQGNIFKLHPNGDGTYAYTDLYDFTGGIDGGAPESNLVMDANGNLYGTTIGGGSDNCVPGCGLVFELTP